MLSERLRGIGTRQANDTTAPVILPHSYVLNNIFHIAGNSHGDVHVMLGYRHRVEIQIRFQDVDAMDHVHHANYLAYAEHARLRYYDAVLGTTESDWHSQHGLIMARSEVDYRKPLMLDDRAAIYTRCARIGTKSFQLAWLLVRDSAAGEETVAEGKTVIVCYDYATQSTVEIPVQRRKLLEAFDSPGNG